MSEHLVHQLAADLGGKVNEVQRLPDGSGFAVVSYPLPADHWLTAAPEYENPPMPLRMGTAHPSRAEFAKALQAAGRYAVRAATDHGKEPDFDPDALIQNLIVGMLGYETPTGLSEDPDANPAGETPA